MRFRFLVLTLAVASALATAATASARMRLVSVTSPASPGSHATLIASVSPASTCSITVLYKSGPSHAQGLYPKRPSGGRVSWTWMVGTRTTPGRWGIVVSCGSAGTLRTSFVVR
jgi:micrococcal nuclease